MRQIPIPQSSDEVRTLMALVQDEPVLLQDQEQDNAVVVLSREDYDSTRTALVNDLLDLCDDMAEEAEVNGLTDEILMDILSQK